MPRSVRSVVILVGGIGFVLCASFLSYQPAAVAQGQVTPGPSPTPGCIPAPSGMVAWYPLDEAPGATVVSDVWGGHHGTPLPGPVDGGPSPGGGPVWTPALTNVSPPWKVLGSLYFMDPARLVSVPHAAVLDVSHTGSFSIEGWIHTVSHVGGGPVDFFSPITDKFDTASGLGYGLYIRHSTTGSSHLEFAYGDGTSTSTVTSNPAVTQLAWNHVAVTIEQLATGMLDILLYVDGVLEGSALSPAPAAPIASSQPLHIGGDRLWPSVVGNVGYTEIAVDELEFFDRPLQAIEVVGLFTADSYGKCRDIDETPTAPPGTPTPTATRTPAFGPLPVLLPAAIKGLVGNIGVSTLAPATSSATGTATDTPRPTATSTQPETGTHTATPTRPPDTETPEPSHTPDPRTPTETPSATPTEPSTTATPTPTVEPGTGTATMTPTPTATDASPTATATLELGCASQPEGMMAWWPLDELTGTEAQDVVGGHHGEADGGVTVEDPARVAAGRAFDGQSGRIAVAHAAQLDPGEGDFAIDAWIRRSESGMTGLQPIVSKVYAPADAPLGYMLGLVDGRLTFAASGEGIQIQVTSPSAIPADGEWHFVAVSLNRHDEPAGSFLYANGEIVEAFEGTEPGAIEAPTELLIGALPSLGRGLPEAHFNGAIDEVEIFRRPVTEAELDAIYAAGSHGKCGKPTADRPASDRSWSSGEGWWTPHAIWRYLTENWLQWPTFPGGRD